MNIEANRNEDWMKLKCSEVKQHFNTIKLGGGKKAIEKQHDKNKLTPRERIDYLLDKDKPFV
jgi:acetyl-CoA carboxylase carboxyltransferase component